MRIKMTFELPVEIFKEDRWFIGYCRALDVSSHGDTPEEAKSHLEEALLLFLESCIERGVLEEVFRDCGFSPASYENESESKASETTGDTIDIPVYLLANFADWDQCHHA